MPNRMCWILQLTRLHSHPYWQINKFEHTKSWVHIVTHSGKWLTRIQSDYCFANHCQIIPQSQKLFSIEFCMYSVSVMSFIDTDKSCIKFHCKPITNLQLGMLLFFTLIRPAQAGNNVLFVSASARINVLMVSEVETCEAGAVTGWQIIRHWFEQTTPACQYDFALYWGKVSGLNTASPWTKRVQKSVRTLSCQAFSFLRLRSNTVFCSWNWNIDQNTRHCSSSIWWVIFARWMIFARWKSSICMLVKSSKKSPRSWSDILSRRAQSSIAVRRRSGCGNLPPDNTPIPYK